MPTPNVTGFSSLEDILSAIFGEQYGPQLANVLRPPTPRSDEELSASFGQQFNPYFNELRGDVNTAFNVGLQRAQQDLASQQAGFDFERNQSNRQFVGSQNQQFGEAYGSPMQQQLAMERANELNRQRRLLQTQFQRQEYDLGELKRKGLRDIGYQREGALADYVGANRYSNLDL